MNPVIQSARLDLIPLTPAVLRAVLSGNHSEAGELLGITMPEECEIPRGVMEFRLGEMEAHPALQPWLLKAISLREPGTFVGHIGFQTAPGPDYLAALCPGGVEFGFGVLEPWKRQGIAVEASEALMRWAREEHQVSRFVLCINPDNAASLGVAARLGFRHIGSHIDEENEPEDIFEKRDESSE